LQNRQLLDTKLTALVGESYKRAYKAVIRAQQLSELEEVIAVAQVSLCHTSTRAIDSVNDGRDAIGDSPRLGNDRSKIETVANVIPGNGDDCAQRCAVHVFP
jgi:hypothetical protein